MALVNSEYHAGDAIRRSIAANFPQTRTKRSAGRFAYLRPAKFNGGYITADDTAILRGAGRV